MLRKVQLDPNNPKASSAAILEAWRDGLVVVIQPTQPVSDVRATYHALLPHIGTPHFLAEDVRVGDRSSQRNGELWSEVRYDPSFTDAYRHSPNAQPLHTDGSYIAKFPNATLMCCVANAGEGGETVFIPAEELVSVLRAEDPKLLEALEQVPMPHARSGDERIHPVIRREKGELRLNWNYYCVAENCSEQVAGLRERFFRFLKESPGVRRAITPVKLRPGEAVVWKDERLLHGRNAFTASAASERFLWKCAIDVGVFA